MAVREGGGRGAAGGGGEGAGKGRVLRCCVVLLPKARLFFQAFLLTVGSISQTQTPFSLTRSI